LPLLAGPLGLGLPRRPLLIPLLAEGVKLRGQAVVLLPEGGQPGRLVGRATDRGTRLVEFREEGRDLLPKPVLLLAEGRALALQRVALLAERRGSPLQPFERLFEGRVGGQLQRRRGRPLTLGEARVDQELVLATLADHLASDVLLADP